MTVFVQLKKSWLNGSTLTNASNSNSLTLLEKRRQHDIYRARARQNFHLIALKTEIINTLMLCETE